MYHYLGRSFVTFRLIKGLPHAPMECFHRFNHFIPLTIKNKSLGQILVHSIPDIKSGNALTCPTGSKSHRTESHSTALLC